MEQCKISNMYTLEETIAKDYLAQFTYPWEALAGIGDYIKELGKTLNPDVYEQKGEDIWVAKSAAVAPTACLNGPLLMKMLKYDTVHSFVVMQLSEKERW